MKCLYGCRLNKFYGKKILKMRKQDELKKLFEEAYPYRTELHAHTKPISTCSDVPAEVAVELYKARGYDSLVVVNHFTPDYFYKRIGTRDVKASVEFYLQDYRKALEAGKKVGLNVILAAELRFPEQNSNDYLIFGIDEEDLCDIFPMLTGTVEEFYANYCDETKFLFQAHPMRNGQVVMPPETVDGYESFNFHPNHNSRPALATRYVKSVNKPFIAGTDFHEFGHEGLSAIRTKTPLVNSHDVVKAIRENDYILETDGSLIIP